MSRHTVPHPEGAEIVMGYDPPLRAFFGQRFDAEGEEVVAGYPTRYGLGIQPRLETTDAAMHDLLRLFEWAVGQGVVQDSVAQVLGALIAEWRTDQSVMPEPYRLLRPALEEAGAMRDPGRAGEEEI